MVRQIMKDPLFLSIKSEDAGIGDIRTAMDLLETLAAHSGECVGMAANMIGVSKRIIAYTDDNDGMNRVMFNPEIVDKKGEYDAREGCLSLPGVRSTKRWRRITVEYQDINFKKCRAEFRGFTAQIIQHEIDMTNGILI